MSSFVLVRFGGCLMTQPLRVLFFPGLLTCLLGGTRSCLLFYKVGLKGIEGVCISLSIYLREFLFQDIHFFFVIRVAGEVGPFIGIALMIIEDLQPA